jgi:hypothetical protein
MKKTNRTAVFLCLFICCISCKKNNEDNSTALSCKIITSIGGPETFHFTYDEGRLSTLHIAPTKLKMTYTYEGNITHVLVEFNGKFQSKYTFTNNSQGFTTNMRWYTDEAGTEWNNQSIEYNGTQIAKMLYTSSNPNSPVVAVKYTWKNGNLFSQESGNNIIYFEYYTDKPAVAGEWRKYNELTEGYHLYDNKNCTKSMKVGGEVTNFTYEYDASGKIVKMTILEPGNAESAVQYEYSCK